MKFFVLFISFIVSVTVAEAQRIRVNGDVKTKKEVPVSGVLVMAFENGTLLRSNVSDGKGEYSFNVDRLKFDLLYYKPGLLSHTYTVNNKLDKETQGFYKYVQMDDSLAETVVDLNVWLKRHHLTPAYMDSVYKEELRKIVPSDTAVHKSRRQIKQEALAEQKRFSNYKKTTDKETIDNQESDVTKVVIGPDTYEMITSEKGGKKYFKNDKPITEVTYKFETTRRYEGVLKSTKDVRKFDKYKPMEHVKGT
jgi:hypothetical protein